MKWRMVDQVRSVEAWRKIEGRKAISLDEYFQRKALGDLGCFPRTLLLASVVELTRWLVVFGSEFALTCVIDEVEDFLVTAKVGPGACLDLFVEVLSRNESSLSVSCLILVEGEEVAKGHLVVSLQALADSFDPTWLRGLWGEMYGQA